MSNDANVKFKMKSAIWGVAIAILVGAPANTYAQDASGLPELEMETEESQISTDIDIDDVLKEIDDALPEEVTPEPAAENVAKPATEKLMDPKVANAKAASEQVINIPEIPSVKAEDAPEDNLFFDADALVPRSELSRKGAPRKVNPATEPGSKLILVKKNFSASSKTAELTSARRAMKLGRYSAALEMYEVMYAKNKRDPNILMGRAEAYHRLGQDDFAVQAYEKLLDIRPKNVEARINMLGIIGEKYPAVALRQLLDLRQEDNNNVGIVAQIAVVQAKLGSYEDAIHYLSVAASMEPQNPSHIFNMAVVADTAGSKDQAIQFYEQALEIDTLYGKGDSIPRSQIFERLAGLR